MYVLGLATMDNSAACLMRDGDIVAAVENERLTRVKNDNAFPFEAIEECLAIGGITIRDLDQIAVFWQPWRLRQRSVETLKKMLRDPGSVAGTAARVRNLFIADPGARETGGWRDLFRLKKKLAGRFGDFDAEITHFDHHLTHQLYGETMRDWSEYVSLSYDGGGEDASTVLSVVSSGKRHEISRHLWPNSLGHFYSVFTGYLGFRMLEGEYKMMGLAPYGTPKWKDTILSDVLRLEGGGRYRLNTRIADYHGARKGRFSARLAELTCPPRTPDSAPTADHIDLAASVQAAFEAALSHVLAPAREEFPHIRNLVLSGGCALNGTANGGLLQSGAFEVIAIPPAPHDAGCAVGACLAALEDRGIKSDEDGLRSPYLGAEYQPDEIAAALGPVLRDLPAALSETALVSQTADLLERGKIVAWFQGRSEFGPRALGARSFLADPRRDEIREIANEKIKKRELFRPFAPSSTAEAAPDFFELEQTSPYMNIVARVRTEKASEIPAVTHADGTARVHTVTKDSNPLYHALLSEFGKRTGVPVLLNTSFNIQEPIVYSPDHAVRTFAASGVEALAIGPYLVTRDLLK